MLWLAVRFPTLALDAVGRVREPGPAPRAVLDIDAAIPRVLHPCARAHHAGVRPGQSAAAARALCPGLECVARDARAESTLKDLLGAWAYGFSDAVSLALPDAVVIEIGASLKLLGGWRKIERRLSDELGALAVTATWAVAPTPRAAWVLAGVHHGLFLDHAIPFQRALGELPLRVLGFDLKTLEALHGMGFRRLRELRALPRAALGRRVGIALIDALDRLYGETADALARYAPPARFEAQVTFDTRVSALEALRFPLKRLIDDLARTLSQRDGGVARFDIMLRHDAAAATVIEVGLVDTERDPERLFSVALSRLERVTLSAPVEGIKLVAAALPPFAAPNRDLFERARGIHALDFAALIERFRARLGDDAVTTVELTADHRPRLGQRVRALTRGALAEPAAAYRAGTAAAKKLPSRPLAGRAVDGAVAPMQVSGAGTRAANDAKNAQTWPNTPRPLWLLERPIPLRAIPRELIAGPERIESGWWDGCDLRRDFYLARLDDGAHAWISAAVGEREGFMLEGFP